MLISGPTVTLRRETVELHFHLFVEKETGGGGGELVEKHENMRPPFVSCTPTLTSGPVIDNTQLGYCGSCLFYLSFSLTHTHRHTHTRCTCV